MEIQRHEIVQVKVWISENQRFFSRHNVPERMHAIYMWLNKHGIQAHFDRTRRLTFYGDYVTMADEKDRWAVFALPIDLALMFKLAWGGK